MADLPASIPEFLAAVEAAGARGYAVDRIDRERHPTWILTVANSAL